MRFWGVNFWSRFFFGGGGWGEGYFCPDSIIHVNWNPQYPRERSSGCVEITAFCFHTSRSQYKPPDPGDPANGDRNPPLRNGSSDYPQGSMIRYTCYPHYNLHGPVTRTCLADGSWSKKAPECLGEYIERSTTGSRFAFATPPLVSPRNDVRVSRHHHWFSREMTSEKRPQKFHFDDESLSRSW